MLEAQDPIANLAKASRRFAILSFLGLLMVFVALIYASAKLNSLQEQTNKQKQELAALKKDEEATQLRIEGLNQEIAAKTKIYQGLSQLIAQSKDSSLVQKATEVQLSPLNGFKLGIYFLQGNTAAEERAAKLRAALLAQKYPGSAIQLYPKDMDFFHLAATPKSDEIRYEPGFETAQAQALLKLLNIVDPAHSYSLREVANRTSNFISIFLDAGF